MFRSAGESAQVGESAQFWLLTCLFDSDGVFLISLPLTCSRQYTKNTTLQSTIYLPGSLSSESAVLRGSERRHVTFHYGKVDRGEDPKSTKITERICLACHNIATTVERHSDEGE